MSRRTPNLLPQISFSILLALSLKPRHGYEIIKQIESDSASRLKLGPGALYGAIKQLQEDNLIKEVPLQAGDARRRYYQLTKAGRAKLGADVQYFESTVRLARQRNLLGDAIWAH